MESKTLCIREFKKTKYIDYPYFAISKKAIYGVNLRYEDVLSLLFVRCFKPPVLDAGVRMTKVCVTSVLRVHRRNNKQQSS